MGIRPFEKLYFGFNLHIRVKAEKMASANKLWDIMKKYSTLIGCRQNFGKMDVEIDKWLFKEFICNPYSNYKLWVDKKKNTLNNFRIFSLKV